MAALFFPPSSSFVCFIFLFNATTRARAYISICLRAVLVSLAEYFIHDHEPYSDTLNTAHNTHTETTNQFDGYATTLCRNPLFNFIFNVISHLLQVDYAFIAHTKRGGEGGGGVGDNFNW